MFVMNFVVSFVTQGMMLQELTKQQLPGDGAYNAVLSLSASAAAHSLQTLGILVALAKPGATVVVQEVVAARPGEVRLISPPSAAGVPDSRFCSRCPDAQAPLG